MDTAIRPQLGVSIGSSVSWGEVESVQPEPQLQVPIELEEPLLAKPKKGPWKLGRSLTGAPQWKNTEEENPTFTHGTEHFTHDINFVGTATLPEDAPGKFLIDIESLNKTYAEWRTFSHGYKSVCIFLMFLFLYLTLLNHHTCEPAMGEVNAGLKNMVDLTKADMKVSNVDSLWKWVTGVYLKLVFSETWDFKNANNDTIMGRATANKRFLVIGMVSITAIKSQAKICYHSQPCYSADSSLQDPFAELVLPSSETVPIPYNSYTGGYTLGIPTGATAAEQATLLKAFQPFFGQETTAVHIQTVLLNPLVRSTLTSLIVKGTFSVYGEVSFNVELDTIPYQPYDFSGSFGWIHLLEGLIVILALRWFVGPYVVYWFREPNFRQCRREGRGISAKVAYLKWLDQWDHLARSPFGQATRAYVPLFVGFGGALVLWVIYVSSYLALHNGNTLLAQGGGVEETSLPNLFRAMRTSDQHNTTKLVVDSLAIVHGYIPLLDTLSKISLIYSYYFVWQTFTVGVMLWLLVEHLRFQKRLSHMTDTLKAVTKEVFGLGFLVVIVCCMIGVMCSLAFGSLDPNFRSLWTSFVPILETCLGLFRPQTDMNLRSSPGYKYVPHIGVESSAQFMPMLLMAVFKLVVFMFIFKLLMGVVMSAWRDSRKGVTLSNLTETHAQIKLLWQYGVSMYWHHMVQGKPFVRWDILCLALQCRPPLKDPSPWHSRFIGLDGQTTDLLDALNHAVSSESLGEGPEESWQYAMIQVLGFTDTVFTDKQAGFAMKAYGRRRRGAIASLVEEERKNQYKERLQQLTDPYAHQNKKDAKEYAEQEARKVLADFGSDVTESDIKLRKPPKEELDKVFQSCDVFCTGQIYFYFMEEVLERLGFKHLAGGPLRKLLQKYDEDMNMSLDREEIHDFIHDDALCGRRTGGDILEDDEEDKPQKCCCMC